MIVQTSDRSRAFALHANRWVYWLSRNWLLAFSLGWGLFIGLPWLAPVFMKVGWTSIGNALYWLYALECHQLPQRTYFLFGSKLTYSLAEIQAIWQTTNNPLLLRQFIGNAQMGWKVAWCERTIWMYGSIWVCPWVYKLVRQRLPTLPRWGLAWLLVPIIIDGGTHFLSDLAGIGNGFRDNNAWLAALTGQVFPAAFYAGDAFGSFNSWARLITGVLAGIGLVGLAFPHLENTFTDVAREIEAKLQQAGFKVS
jgi:uncharacterized membrane protein